MPGIPGYARHVLLPLFVYPSYPSRTIKGDLFRLILPFDFPPKAGKEAKKKEPGSRKEQASVSALPVPLTPCAWASHAAFGGPRSFL